MTDITELAQSLKAAAEKANALNLDTAQEVRDEDGYLECPVCGGEGSVDAERDYCNIDGVALGIQFYGIGEHHGLAEQYFRIATPANILALVEGLEKAQQRNGELETYSKTAIEFREVARNENRHLKLELEIAEKRIADLESRTVKLPDLRQIVSGDRYVWSDGVYNYSQDVKVALAAAGIKVEAE